MAEAGNEHRIVDRRGDRVAAAGQQRGGDGALVAVQRRSDPRIDRIAQPLHEGGVTQRQTASDRRLDGLDGARDKTGSADALEKHVAAEIVAARPQRRERRLQPRLQFDKTADVRRGALAHRQPHALEFGRQTRGVHLRDPQHEPVGALADVAGLDKARKRHRISRPGQHAMRDPRGFPCRGRETRRDGGDHHGRRKQLLPPQQKRRHAKSGRGENGNRQDRLMIGGEIEGDPGAEGDRHPGQQPAGAGLGAHPFAQLDREGRPGVESGRRKAACPRGLARRPGPRITPRPSPARLRHSAAPRTPYRPRCYRGVSHREKRNGCRMLGKAQIPGHA